MPCPENGIYIVTGEMSVVISAMRRGNRWSSHITQDEDQDSLLRNFFNLREILNHVNGLEDLEPTAFLSPFLDVIRSQDTTGPITGFALSAVNKFLSYDLIDPKCENASAAVENIADSVTHARFVGTDPASDEVVLMKILQVLRTLLLTACGTLLTNESVCEIMQSCFRICFETRLSELLRNSAEHAVVDMVQLLFCRLPTFSEDTKYISLKKLKMKAGGMESSRTTKKRRSPRLKRTTPNKVEDHVTLPTPPVSTANTPETSNPITVLGQEKEISPEEGSSSEPSERSREASEQPQTVSADQSYEESFGGEINLENVSEAKSCSLDLKSNEMESLEPFSLSPKPKYVTMDGNSDFGSSLTTEEITVAIGDNSSLSNGKEGTGPLIPYGLPCVRELFRFLLSLINPLDPQNSDPMMHIGLSLLTVALESGADSIGYFNCLLNLVKDEMARNLLSLSNSEKITVFGSAQRVSFLLFESLRTHLKFQLEAYLIRLMDIIVSESTRISYEHREIALDSIVQLWRIPGLVTELYLNYDCDLYCSNLFEDLTKLLSKNAFPVSGLYSTHLLSLDTLLTVIDSIEAHCHFRILNESQISRSPETKDALNQQDKASMSILDGGKAFLTLAPSGYIMNSSLPVSENLKKIDPSSRDRKNPQIKPNRMKPVTEIPSHEELMAIKHRKKLLCSGTDHFNTKPIKGIAFLQEHGLIKDPLDPQEVGLFLRDNPKLDKRMIGDYISNRKNFKILEAFVNSFSFDETRIDEALRMYLESFRLPGEAALISLLLEHFAEHWHKSNGEPFANSDAAFTLAYAVIMLNVDQHNYNVKRQNIPMTIEEFKKNLTKVNGGKDFDEDMLEEIYSAIKNDEIVMPAEQIGLVKENYLWKVLLRRGSSKEGVFNHAPNGLFDHDLFSLCWGPTVAGLSYIFDKSTEGQIIQKAISGFRKCAMISAHYGMTDVFDNLVISLCKYTSLFNSTETPETLSISFGSNTKAQLAARTVFNLAHRHGDILREGWKNLLDCVLQLFRAKILPKSMIEAEDFVSPNGTILLIHEDTPTMPRMESGLFSSFYSYITLTADPQAQKSPTPEEEALKELALDCIYDCHPEQLITESKFLRIDSLQELMKALIYECHGPESNTNLSTSYDEDSVVFILELLVKIVLQNRDRVSSIWPAVQDHLYSLMMTAAITDHFYLLERAIVGILRISIRMMRKEEMGAQVLQSLKLLLHLKPSTLYRVSRQVSFAVHELLKTSAANIHSSSDWTTVFTLMESVGAGAKPPRLLPQSSSSLGGSTNDLDHGAQSDSELSTSRMARDSGHGSDKGYTSDSELYDGCSNLRHHPHLSNQVHKNSTDSVGSSSGWILVGQDDVETVQIRPLPVNQFNIILEKELQAHDPFAFVKCCESLAFLVRDLAHITPHNFECCVQCIRTFVEASLNGGFNVHRKTAKSIKDTKERKGGRGAPTKKKEELKVRSKRAQTSPNRNNQGYEADDDEDKTEKLPPGYQEASLQLLDLMHTLHTRAASIFQSWANEAGEEEISRSHSLWQNCWCPLLQGIARLCCDKRRNVRTSALTYLQRALLVHDLQTLSAMEWEACFNQVLFPLLSKLLENLSPQDPFGMEETRVRGATLLCKVFLQHLNPLLSLTTFTALWLTILDFMDKYMHAEGSDLLKEAIPESLKNMLLVMETASIFNRPNDQPDSEDHQLWTITWDRIDSFLPKLREEVFKPLPTQQSQKEVNSDTEERESSSSPIQPTSCDSVQISIEEDQPETPVKLKPNLPVTLPASPPSFLVPNDSGIFINSITSSNINFPLNCHIVAQSASRSPSMVILHPPSVPQISGSVNSFQQHPETLPLRIDAGQQDFPNLQKHQSS